MAYYLIDFENVKSRGMEGVELLTEEDTVSIIAVKNTDRVYLRKKPWHGRRGASDGGRHCLYFLQR